jgi:hypothetical protein
MVAKSYQCTLIKLACGKHFAASSEHCGLKGLQREVTMSNEELEDALMSEIELRIYTSSIGRFIEGHMFILHWPALPDAFLLETKDLSVHAPDQSTFYCIQRSDPSLIVEHA